MKNNKPDYAPKRFIQKTRMGDHVGRAVRDYARVFGIIKEIKIVKNRSRGHSPRKRGFRAESLLIEEIAPAPERLSDQ